MVRPEGFEPPASWFVVVAEECACIGNQQLRWPALVQILAERRTLPQEPYVFATVTGVDPEPPLASGSFRAHQLRKQGVSARLLRQLHLAQERLNNGGQMRDS
jgi:hypothetical protein